MTGTPEPKIIRLFSTFQVFLATLLGSPIAGAILISLNFKSLGNPKLSRLVFLCGLIGTLALIPLVFFLPDSVPALVVPLSYSIGVVIWFQQTQGKTINEHFAAGGLKSSTFKAVLIGLLCCLMFTSLFAGILEMLPESMLE